MKRHTGILCLLVCALIWVSCQQVKEGGAATTQPSTDASPLESSPHVSPLAAATQPPYVFAESKPETVTIHGELLATDPDNLPDPNDGIYLVPLPDGQVTMIPPIAAGEVPQADVDEATGEFVFTNVEPGLYAVVVRTVSNAEIPARTEEGTFAILRIEEADRNQTIELGYIQVP